MSVFNKLTRTFPGTILFNDIQVPRKLDKITHIGPEDRDLIKANMSEKNIKKIWKAMEDFYRSGAHPAMVFSLRRNGEHVMNRSIGHAQGQQGEDDALVASVDMPVCLFSASKAVTALLVHKLAEEGFLDLEAPIAKYIPEFGVHGKDKITIDDLLRHRAGVPLLKLKQIDDLYNHDLVMNVLCNAKLDILWGSWQGYHAITGGHLISELVFRATGDSISVLLDRYFRQPMGMKYFTYGLDAQYEDRVAHNHCTGMKLFFPTTTFIKSVLGYDMGPVVEASNEHGFLNAIIPAANMYATAEECTRFYQMILDGGTYQGRQIVKPETIKRALDAPTLPTYDRQFKLPVRFSSGFMMGGAPVFFWGYNAPNAYGHIGLLNIFTWADPDRNISCSLITTGKQVLGPHLLTLGMLMTQINNQCSKQT